MHSTRAKRAGHDHYPFCNTSLSLDDRVRDLVSRIKDEDKPNLLTARGHLPHVADAAGQQALPYAIACPRSTFLPHHRARF